MEEPIPSDQFARITKLARWLKERGVDLSSIEEEYKKNDGSEDLSSEETLQEFEQYLFNSAFQMGYKPALEEKNQ